MLPSLGSTRIVLQDALLELSLAWPKSVWLVLSKRSGSISCWTSFWELSSSSSDSLTEMISSLTSIISNSSLLSPIFKLLSDGNFPFSTWVLVGTTEAGWSDTFSSWLVLEHWRFSFPWESPLQFLGTNVEADSFIFYGWLLYEWVLGSESWPDFLKITKQECSKELRSSNSIRLVVPTENGTFQDNASKLFNNLPETIRNCKDYRTFLRLSRNFLCNRVQSD